MSEIDKIDIQMSTVKVEPVDSEENSVEYTPNEAACFIQGQLKQEPLDIKEEPFESEDEKMQDDGGTVFRDANVSKSKSRKRKWKCSKVVETIQNKCYICDTTLESRNAFNDHLESHKNILPYKCTQCSTESNPIIFTTVVLLSRHFETHGFNYPCQECPLRFRTTTRLSYHIQNMHNRKTVEYQCKFCGKVFTNSYVYQSHVLVHKNLITQRFKCELCGKLFTSQHVLLKHQKAHTKPKENKPAKKSTKIERPKPDKLETTDNEGTPNQSEFTDECYICDTSFESRSDLNVHLESHKTMVPYRCSQCSNIAKFYTVTSLNKHFARHRFDYICPHCPSRFRSCRPLTLHMRNSHQGLTAEYKCKTCARIFTNSTGFQLHLKTHKHPKKQRPKCEPCQKVFFSERVLLGHRKTFMCMRK